MLQVEMSVCRGRAQSQTVKVLAYISNTASRVGRVCNINGNRRTNLGAVIRRYDNFLGVWRAYTIYGNQVKNSISG